MASTLLALDTAALAEWVTTHGGQAFHAKIIRGDVLERGILDYGQMTSLPADLRAALIAELPILSSAETTRTVSRDKTIKVLLQFPDGGGSVEMVHIPPHNKADTRGATLCVSTQVGCPVGCPFCASGIGGLERNLDAHEILEQFLIGRQVGPLRRAVVMGMGEPLLNMEALNIALAAVHDEMGLGARKITVSTVGFPDRLHKAARQKPRFELAISLHTADDAQRDNLVPAMKGVPIEEILAAGDDWFEQTGREITYEIALLGGENDTPWHAQRLAERLQGRRCMVNLIPWNPSPGMNFRRPELGTPEAFRDDLIAHGLVATVRWSKGLDGDAACGQLRQRVKQG
jgi:23S rRNA (adenine2503-C2)-methyltransferase